MGARLLTGERLSAHGDGELVHVEALAGEGDGVAVVTMNGAHNQNVLDEAMMVALTAAFDSVSAARTPDPNDDAIRAVILRAEGRAFTGGIPISGLGDSDYFDEGFHREANPFAAIAECPFPTVGAVNGIAVTGGFEIALNCDCLVATPNALFMDNHAKYGVHPSGNLSWLLARSVGINNARLATLASYPIDGRTALQWGLVQRLADDDVALEREALALAKLIAANHPLATKMSKQLHRDNLLGRGTGPELEHASDKAFYPALSDLHATVADGGEKFEAMLRWAEQRDRTGPDGYRTSA